MIYEHSSFHASRKKQAVLDLASEKATAQTFLGGPPLPFAFLLSDEAISSFCKRFPLPRHFLVYRSHTGGISMRRSKMMLSFMLALSLTAPSFGSGKGGGGGGGTPNPPLNPFVGNWRGGFEEPPHVQLLIKFNKDFSFTATEFDGTTGLPIGNWAGTYSSVSGGPVELPIVTLVSGGQIVMKGGYEFGRGALLIETATAVVLLGRLD
jgi:hypothetical protein